MWKWKLEGRYGHAQSRRLVSANDSLTWSLGTKKEIPATAMRMTEGRKVWLMWKVSFLWDGKFAYQLCNSGKYGKFMYQLHSRWKVLRFVYQLKRQWKVRTCLQLLKIRWKVFNFQPVGRAAVQVQEEESFFDIVGTRSGRFAPLMLSRYSATNIR